MLSRFVLPAVAAAALLVSGSGAALADGDAAAGKKVFNKCKVCHTVEAGQHKVGPSLAGVIGRAAGAAEDFNYSDAMKESGVTWDVESLDKYLANPKEFIPGNKMAFVGLKKEEDRANVIAYLQAEAQ